MRCKRPAPPRLKVNRVYLPTPSSREPAIKPGSREEIAAYKAGLCTWCGVNPAVPSGTECGCRYTTISTPDDAQLAQPQPASESEHQGLVNVLSVLGSAATVAGAPDIAAYAIEYAAAGYEVGPLCHRGRDANGMITSKILSPYGKDPNGRLVPHGHLDFTNDVATVCRWWSKTPWNIGVRVPESMFVLDVDDLTVLAEWEAVYGKLPETLTTISGREAGGRHYWFWHPGGKIRTKIVKGAVETKTNTGYVVVAPSVHPHSGNTYTRIEAPIAHPPAWLIDKVRQEPKPAPRPAPRSGRRLFQHYGPSPADNYTNNNSWPDVLGPHGWKCLDADPDADGARWLHPTATSSCSATIKHGLMFVYSTSTDFEVTESGDTHGYTRFRAYAVLNHGGDMKAATRALTRTERTR
jgi:hypothetical protein